MHPLLAHVEMQRLRGACTPLTLPLVAASNHCCFGAESVVVFLRRL